VEAGAYGAPVAVDDEVGTDRTGVRVFAFGRAAPGQTEDDFHAAWRAVHEGLLGDPACRPSIRSIELFRRLPDDPAARPPAAASDGPMGNGYDGVAVLTVDDLDAFDAVRRAAAPAAPAAPAVSPGGDGGGLWYGDGDVAWVVTRAPDLIVGPPGGDPSASIVFFCILRRHDGWTLDAFHDHWLHQHADILRTNPALRDPLRGYEQHHGIGGPDARFDGVTQQWFETLAERDAGLASPAHREHEAPDVATFLDPVEMFWILTERAGVLVP